MLFVVFEDHDRDQNLLEEGLVNSFHSSVRKTNLLYRIGVLHVVNVGKGKVPQSRECDTAQLSCLQRIEL